MRTPWTASPFEFRALTKVVMVLDVVESVRLMEQDQREFVQRWHHFVEQVRGLLPAHGGHLHKSLGDGLMLEFDEARAAVRTAAGLQELAAELNAGRPAERQIHLRIGAHVCDFVADQYDIYGADVNLTARIAALAGPGEVVISAALRDQITAGLDADIEDLGECHLKHVRQPVRAYRVGPVGHAPLILRGSGVRLQLRPTIAVVPFTIRSEDPGHRLLGEAVADDIIAALSRTEQLHVISRLSTTAFTGRAQALGELQSHLGADYVLSGSCRSMGGRLRLFAELTDAKAGHVVWADSIEGSLGGLFAADDQLIARIVRATCASVMVSELQRARGKSLPTLEGYTLLLAAVGLMHRLSRPDFERAHEMLDALISRAPRQPVPQAWMAKWHVLRVSQGWTDDVRRDASLALDCTRRALDDDPECALALTIDGLVHANLLKRHDVAAERYAQALERNPNEPLAWLLKGTLLAFMGRGDEAVEDTETALSLSPLDPMRYYFDSLSATAAMSAGRYERAIQLAKRSLRANRTHASTIRALVISQVGAGRLEEARQSAGMLLAVEPAFTVGKFIKESPSSMYPLGQRCAAALREAGVPE